MKFKKWLFGLGLIPMFALASCKTLDVKETETRVSMCNDIGVMSLNEDDLMIAAYTGISTELFNLIESKKNDSYGYYNYSKIDYYEEYNSQYGIQDYNVFDMFSKIYATFDLSQSGTKYVNDIPEKITFKLGCVYLTDLPYATNLFENGVSYDNSYIYAFDNEVFYSDREMYNGLDSSLIDEMQSIMDSIEYGANSGACLAIVPKYTYTTTSAIYDEDCNGVWEYKQFDEIAPDFTNELYYIPVNVDNPLSTSEILALIKATDETDGDISSSVQLISTSYNPENATVGTYPFKVKVADNSGNETTGTFYVQVYDLIAPVITGTDYYEYEYDDTENVVKLANILDNLSVKDNYYSGCGIVVISDEYTGNESKVGSYNIVVNSTDESDNVSEDFNIIVNVKDSKAPIITCPSEIELATSKLYSSTEIAKKIVIEDGYDGVITSYSFDGYNAYKENYNVVGTYPVKISATDTSGNTSSFTFNIITSDKIEPVISVLRNVVINIPLGSQLTDDMIIRFLTSIGEIDSTQIKKVNYSLSTSKVGVYECEIIMNDDSVYTTSINVVKYDENGDVDEFNPSDLITKEFYVELWKSYVDSWKTFELWDWKNWTTITIVAFVILGLIAFVVSKLPSAKKKKKQDNRYWY